jgi:chemotaxis protein MotB
MARKHKHPEHVNHERWLVSYADFITLLFAFFVVMFAVSQVDSKKLGRFTESFKEATEWQVFNSGGQGLLPGGKDSRAIGEPKTGATMTGLAAEAAEFSDQKKSIRKALQQRAVVTPALTGLKLVDARDELVLRLPERLMFDRADAALHEEGREALLAIVDELAPRSVRIRIEGHTDSMPIHTPKFPSNWELSTTRAMTVVGLMIETKKIAPERLAAAGYSEHHPVDTNDTVEGRSHNRRVDIVVIANPQTPPPPPESSLAPAPHEGASAANQAPSASATSASPSPLGSAGGASSPHGGPHGEHAAETRP